MPHVPRLPLLALVNATAEWHAGVPSVCSASVRLLDRVHFTVYRGDCVVVHHDDPASAQVLLAALGGHRASPIGRHLLGERRCAPGVRIRRCSIPVGALAALHESATDIATEVATGRVTDGGRSSEWRHGVGDPVVHLLRASRQLSLTAAEQRQWRSWGRRVLADGGAMVVVARPEGEEARAPAAGPLALGGAEALRERAAPPYHASVTRALWLHHGRLLSVRRWE